MVSQWDELFVVLFSHPDAGPECRLQVTSQSKLVLVGFCLDFNERVDELRFYLFVRSNDL